MVQNGLQMIAAMNVILQYYYEGTKQYDLGVPPN